MKYLAVLLVSVLAACAFAAAGLLGDPPAAEAAGTTAKKCGGGRISLKTEEKKSLVLHNRRRTERNLKPLCVHPRLQEAARAHSKDMIRRDYFSHGTKGRNEGACERVTRYGFRACGENIAWGTGSKGSPGYIMRSWMKSDGHRRNILGNAYREVGIGTYTGTYDGRQNATMYTADFGSRR